LRGLEEVMTLVPWRIFLKLGEFPPFACFAANVNNPLIIVQFWD
jgi:hypothetical protein